MPIVPKNLLPWRQSDPLNEPTYLSSFDLYALLSQNRHTMYYTFVFPLLVSLTGIGGLQVLLYFALPVAMIVTG